MRAVIWIGLAMVSTVALVSCGGEVKTSKATQTTTEAAIPTTLTSTPNAAEPAASPTLTSDDSVWDVVVLGRVDACFVCQHEPAPSVSYTRVLAGEVPGGQASGQLAVGGVAEHLLPEGGIPIYKSAQEEIILLKKVVVPGYENAGLYSVADVMQTTPENLAKFSGQ